MVGGDFGVVLGGFMVFHEVFEKVLGVFVRFLKGFEGVHGGILKEDFEVLRGF